MNKFIPFFILSLFLIGCVEEDTFNADTESIKILNFDDNEIRFYEKIYFKSYGKSEEKVDFAELKIQYPEIISNSNATDSINKFILDYLLNLPFNEDPITSFDEIADSLISNYISVQQEFDDYHTGWYIHANSNITGVVNGILSITSEETISTGGANVFYDLTYSNFYLISGKQVKLENIIVDNNLIELEKLGETIFVEMKNIRANQSFEEAGFWFENGRFALSDNFAITDSGLVFFYNLYEIAPRGEGTSKLFIPKEMLNSITTIY